MALPKAFFDEDTLVVAAAAFETSSVVAAKGAPVPRPAGKVLSLDFTENVSFLENECRVDFSINR